jgi:hypothetical protein
VLLGLGAAALLIGFVLTVVLPDHRGDGTYYTASRLLLRGQAGPAMYDNAWMQTQIEAATAGRVSDIFRPNPPTAALIALPVAWLPPDAARRAWAGLNTLVLLASLVCLYFSHRPPEPGQADKLAGQMLWLGALAFGLFSDPVVEGIGLGQAYILLLGLYTLAWWGIGRVSVGNNPSHRPVRHAVAVAGLALAGMLKTSGAPIWLLLAARCEWRTLAWAAGVCLAVFGLSLPGLGLDMWHAYATNVLPASAAAASVAITAFQSLPGLWAHLFRFEAAWNPAPLADLPWLASALSLASPAGVIALTLYFTRRARLQLAFGATATASIFLVPFAEQHHYTLAVLPVTMAAAELAGRARRGSLSAVRAPALALCAAMLLIGLPLAYEAVPLSRGTLALLAYPRLCGGLLLWGLLLWIAHDDPRWTAAGTGP